MIEPTRPLSPPAASAPSTGATPAAPAASVPPVAAVTQAGEGAPRRDPVSLSVDRDASGVFVYTLTDSASGRILAVIPRSAVVSPAQSEVNIQA